MKLKFATMCVFTLLAGASESHALTYEGTISGTVTSAHDATFGLLGHQTLTVGDTITGQYSYEYPSEWGWGVSDLHVKLNVGTSYLNIFPQQFYVSGGHIDMWWVSDGSLYSPDVNLYSFYQVTENSVSFSELYEYPTRVEQHYASGQLTFSDPVVKNVSDTAATGPLLSFALGALWYFRRRVNQAQIAKRRELESPEKLN